MIDNIFKLIKNDGISVSLFPKQFDGHQYFIGFTIFNMSDDIQDIFYITPQQFKKLIIRNTLDEFYPTAVFSFIDYQGAYVTKMRPIGQYLKIMVIPPITSGNQQKLRPLDMIFSIENHIIEGRQNAEIHFRLQCKFWTARNFGMHINYSSYINPTESNKLTPYQIIKILMKKINYPIEEIPKSKNKIYLITDQNSTVLEEIKYCLERGCQLGDLPSYICHNILENKPMFINRELPEKQKNLQINFNLQMTSAAGSQVLDKDLVVQNPLIFSANESLHHYSQKALDIGWVYNQQKREWTQEVLMPNKIDDLLTELNVPQVKTSFYPQTYNESNIRHYRYNWQTLTIYDKLKDLQLGANNIQFKIIGNLEREVGQTVNIQCKQLNFKNAYSGFWRIYSIQHIFENSSYLNDIVGYRTITLNNKEDQEKK